MKKLILFLVFLPSFCCTTYSQVYNNLGESSSIDTVGLQQTLKDTAQELIDAFPSAFDDLFTVYSSGFYLHNDDMVAGVPKIFLKYQEIAAAGNYPYYLLIGRQYNKKNEIEKYWIHLKLPTTGVFSCMNESERDVEKQRILTILQQNPSYPKNEVKAMKALKFLVEKQKSCCVNGSYTCPVCDDTELIKKMLIEMGFVGIDVTTISEGTPNTSYQYVVDYSGKSLNGIQLATKANNIIQDLTSSNNIHSVAYITDNNNICQSNFFDQAKNSYQANMNDYDIWIHLWKDNQGGSNTLFVKADYYILADDPDFIPYIEDQPLPLTGGAAPRTTGNPYFLICDTNSGKYYISQLIEPLPGYPYDPIYIPEQPLHIVEAGQTLSSIVSASGGAFTIDDLVAWNPDKLPNENTILQIGWTLKLYNEDYDWLIQDDLNLYGISIPILNKLKDYNNIPRDAIPFHGLIGTPGAPVNYLKDGFKRIEIPGNFPYEEVEEVIDDPSKWEKLTKIKTLGKVFLVLTKAANVVLLVLEPAPVGNYLPMWNLQLKRFEEDPQGKRVYCTYTKYNQNVTNNTPYPPGKVYVGRTSACNAYPQLAISMRDANHHRSNEGYGPACYDDHRYSQTLDYRDRKNDPAYKAIRGREQVFIEALLGAWSMHDNIRDTRSGNKINGIDKNKFLSFYLECTGLSLSYVPFPPVPPFDYVPPPCH